MMSAEFKIGFKLVKIAMYRCPTVVTQLSNNERYKTADSIISVPGLYTVGWDVQYNPWQ